jgi:hypothetical protein
MKFQDNYSKSNNKKTLFLIIIVLAIIFFIYYFRINKFEYTGDINFVDLKRLKIISLTLLKDQPIFWFNKILFENELKNEFPQIKNLSYKVINSDTIEIFIVAEEICCVLQDMNEKNFIISKNGKVLRVYDGSFNSEIKLKTPLGLNIDEQLNFKLIEVLSLLSKSVYKIEDVSENTFYLENDVVYFFTHDQKQVILNENTDYEKFNANLKSMKSFLQQNQKNYSILDFRFEKIVVK